MGGAFEFPVKLCCNSEEEVEEREDNADAIDGFVLHVWLVRKWKGILFCSEKVEEWKGGIRIKKC